MFERFTREARLVVTLAEAEAGDLESPTIEPEHLLLAATRLDRSTPTGAALAELGLDHADVLEALDAERAHSLAAVGISIGDFDLPPARATSKPRMGANSKGALEKALRIALERGDKRIEAGHVLLAVVRSEVGTVARALREAGVDGDELRDRLAAALA